MTALDLPVVGVDPLNALLLRRKTLGGSVKPALGISYLVHLVAALLLLLIARMPGGRGDIGLGRPALLSANLLYQNQGDGGAEPQPAEPPLQPAPVVEPAPEPPVATAADFHEVTRAPTPKPKPTRTPVARPKPTATPRTAAVTPTPSRTTSPRPGGPGSSNGEDLLKVAGNERGSPTGVLGGDPDGDGGGGGGGLGMLIFTDQWYVERIRDIVYRNWGNPFAGRARPANLRLATVVSFRIDRDGRVSEVKLVQPSGNDAWDRSAVRAAENTRLPPLPPSYPGRDLRVRYRFYDEGAP